MVLELIKAHSRRSQKNDKIIKTFFLDVKGSFYLNICMTPPIWENLKAKGFSRVQVFSDSVDHRKIILRGALDDERDSFGVKKPEKSNFYRFSVKWQKNKPKKENWKTIVVPYILEKDDSISITLPE